MRSPNPWQWTRGGLPAWNFPEFSWEKVSRVGAVSFSCFVVILAQSAATARAYAFRFNENLTEGRDLLGLSAANLLAASGSSANINTASSRAS